MSNLNYKKAIRNDKYLILVLQSLSVQMQKTAYSFNNSEDFIEDVISETIYKVYKNRKKVKNPEFLGTWVISILMNECRQELRRRNKYQELYNVDQIQAEQGDDFSYVHGYLSQLNISDQELIRLKIFSGFTFLEIANFLDIPESTVKTRYYTILKKLKWEMEDSYE